MNASNAFPFHLQWTSHDLADAVPLRLHEMFDFDASRDGPVATSADGLARAPRRDWRASGYRLLSNLPAFFRIH
jgi:hypothetical protein